MGVQQDRVLADIWLNLVDTQGDDPQGSKIGTS